MMLVRICRLGDGKVYLRISLEESEDTERILDTVVVTPEKAQRIVNEYLEKYLDGRLSRELEALEAKIREVVRS